MVELEGALFCVSPPTPNWVYVSGRKYYSRNDCDGCEYAGLWINRHTHTHTHTHTSVFLHTDCAITLVTLLHLYCVAKRRPNDSQTIVLCEPQGCWFFFLLKHCKRLFDTIIPTICASWLMASFDWSIQYWLLGKSSWPYCSPAPGLWTTAPVTLLCTNPQCFCRQTNPYMGLIPCGLKTGMHLYFRGKVDLDTNWWGATYWPLRSLHRTAQCLVVEQWLTRNRTTRVWNCRMFSVTHWLSFFHKIISLAELSHWLKAHNSSTNYITHFPIRRQFSESVWSGSGKSLTFEDFENNVAFLSWGNWHAIKLLVNYNYSCMK